MSEREERAKEALDLWEDTPGMSLDMAFLIYGRREAAATLRMAAGLPGLSGEMLLRLAREIEDDEPNAPKRMAAVGRGLGAVTL